MGAAYGVVLGLVQGLPELPNVHGAAALPCAAGVAVAFLPGLWAIRFLMGAIRRGRFRWFAVYCWLIGDYLLLRP